jgi:hypothetical protein
LIFSAGRSELARRASTQAKQALFRVGERFEIDW